MIKVKHKGNFSKLEHFLNVASGRKYLNDAEKTAQAGVVALEAATPKETGKTAASWRYEIESDGKNTRIGWYNENVHDGCNIALLLQYGHGTGTGGYVPGTDYINPAMKPVFDAISDEVWKEVTSR